MISPRKLILVLIKSVQTAGYRDGIQEHNLFKHYSNQLKLLQLERNFTIDEHTLFDYIENLKDLLFIEIKKVDYYKTIILTKYGDALAKNILENDFGYINRNLVMKQIQPTLTLYTRTRGREFTQWFIYFGLTVYKPFFLNALYNLSYLWTAEGYKEGL